MITSANLPDNESQESSTSTLTKTSTDSRSCSSKASDTPCIGDYYLSETINGIVNLAVSLSSERLQQMQETLKGYANNCLASERRELADSFLLYSSIIGALVRVRGQTPISTISNSASKVLSELQTASRDNLPTDSTSCTNGATSLSIASWREDCDCPSCDALGMHGVTI